jgi:1-aminocyclopropane-1-carboxylate deaminase
MPDILDIPVNLPPPVTKVVHGPGLPVTDVLRLDLLHPHLSGNKWFKLKYALAEAKAKGCTRIVTFGGSFSNHIVATACACRLAGIASKGIIRGEAGNTPTHSLQLATAYGMEITFMPRTEYRALRENGFQLAVSDNDYLLPEGGATADGARGAKEILNFALAENYTHIFCAIGTGTTAAGLLQAMRPDQQLVCINVLKGGSFQQEAIIRLSGLPANNLQIRNEFHFGGYARYTNLLVDFMNEFYRQTCIPSDIVYTGKLFFALNHITQQELNNNDTRILVIHSGGLQGNASLPKGTLIF